ncbi:SWIM zinc finger family protein [Nanoarchaeota archaeon]
MNIKKDPDSEGDYLVESSSSEGKFYKVDPKKPWCDCPAYKFRYMKSGKVCKHIAAVRELVADETSEELEVEMKEGEAVRKFIEDAGGEADVVEVIDKFGESLVDNLIEHGELLERRGKITILK